MMHDTPTRNKKKMKTTSNMSSELRVISCIAFPELEASLGAVRQLLTFVSLCLRMAIMSHCAILCFFQ